MALQKLTYTDGVTVIPASNLNAIQDAIIALENKPDNGVSDDLKVALLQLASKVAYIDDQGQTYYQDLYDALYPPKTVVLITAVFEQGSTVIYDDTALNDLKQYLTVTAKYDDNTTAILADSAYTLSGLLEAPSSTVTVLYNGLTTTFTVDVTARPTLSSISAVYTQSGTVYNSDSLDSLKADLVVTATYSDSSTATVAAADYSLSGTLTVGTSTITVSYGGKTTTFTVTVTSDPVYEVYTIGTPSISGNVLTPGDSGMIRTNRVFSPGSSPWKIRVGFTTSGVTTYQDVIGSTDSSGESQRGVLLEGAWYPDPGVCRISSFLSGDGTSWNINKIPVANELVSNTTYLVELEFTGTQYTIHSSTDDGATWTPISTSGSWPSAINSTTAIKGGYYLGVGLKRNGYFKGTIDLTKVKVWVNGDLWWSPVLGA